MSALLTLSGVHTHIGRYHILQGVDFAVPEGATTMLLGRNGAGKTTTLAHHHGPVACVAPARSASTDATSRSAATPDIARAGIAYVPETMAVFSDLTVRENLRACGARRGAIDETRLDWIFGFFPALKKILAVAAPARCPADRNRCCRSRAPSSSRAGSS